MSKIRMMMGIGIATGLMGSIIAPQASALVNGDYEDSNQIKSLTNISIEKSDSFENCSGVLLDNSWVLTASQCVQENVNNDNNMTNNMAFSSSSLSSDPQVNVSDTQGNVGDIVSEENVIVTLQNHLGTNLNAVSDIRVHGDLAMIKIGHNNTNHNVSATMSAQKIGSQNTKTKTYSWGGHNNEPVYTSGTTYLGNNSKLNTTFSDGVKFESRDIGAPIFSQNKLVGIQTGKINTNSYGQDVISGTTVYDNYNWIKGTTAK